MEDADGGAGSTEAGHGDGLSHKILQDQAGHGEHRQVLPGKVKPSVAQEIIDRIRKASRPVINAGNGIRIAGAHKVFMDVAEKLGIPVITGWDSEDCMYDTHPLYVGPREFCHPEQRPGAVHRKPLKHPSGGV